MSQPRRSQMAEDYLKLIWKSQEWDNESISTNEIAAALGVGAPTVSGNLNKLSRDGLLDYEPYGPIRLSERGREVAVQMVRRHRIIETYLVERYGYGWDEVHDEAEVLEHAISARLLSLWDDELGNPERDPHGDPIPRADGSLPLTSTQRLQDAEVGRSCVVVRVSDHDGALLRYLDSLGITVGTTLRVDAVREYAGTVSVTVEDAEPTRCELSLATGNAIRVRAADPS